MVGLLRGIVISRICYLVKDLLSSLLLDFCEILGSVGCDNGVGELA